jgi:hypothetical protein
MSSKGLAGETETFLRYGVNDRLEVGFGYLWRPKVVRPIGSYTLVPETDRRPSLTAGIMFDSLGGGRQGAYVSIAKDLYKPYGIPASVYVGGAKITNEDGGRFIAGLNVYVTNWLSTSVQFDGRYPHLGVTARVGSIGQAPVRLGLVAARGDRLGPLLAINFPLGH